MIKLIFLINLIFVILVQCSGKIEIPIGGIFHERGEETEIAFLAAIEDINKDQLFIEYVPITKYLEFDNGYDAGNVVCDLASEGVAGIFGPFTKHTIPITESICSKLGIPHFIANWIPEPFVRNEQRPRDMTLNLYPNSIELSKAYQDFVTYSKWKGYNIIYETDDDLMKMKGVLQAHSPIDSPITVRQLDADSENYRPLLKQIRKCGVGSWDIILQTNSERYLSILKQAIDVGLYGEYQRVFLTSLDTPSTNFSGIEFDKTNITTLRLIDPHSDIAQEVTEMWNEYAKENHLSFHTEPDHIKVEPALVHDAVKIFTDIIKEIAGRDEFEIPKFYCKSMMFDEEPEKWQTGMQIIKQIKTKKGFQGVTGEIHFDANGDRSEFELEICELVYPSNTFKKFASWTTWSDIVYIRTPAELIEQSKNSLSHKVITVVSKLGKPFLMKKESTGGVHYEGNAQYEGYCMDLIDEISKFLNFTYKFELVQDGNYGNFDPVKKEWNGIVRHVMDRKADVGICDLTITYERRTAVDFSLPFMDLGISILYTKPPPPEKNLFSFLLPFAPDVWLWIGVAILLMTLLFFWLGRLSDDEWISPHPCNLENLERENVWILKNCTWLVIGSLMGQGCDLLPRGVSTRLACGSMWFFALIMLSSYTANLAAFLTNERMESTIENVQQLAEQSKIKYGAVDGGSTLKFFENSNNSLYQKMFTVMKSTRPSVFPKDNDEGAERVLKSKRLYAFLMESSVIEYRVERDCDLVQIGRPLDSKFYGIALPMNSGYRKLFNSAILKLQEHGQLEKLKKKWWKEMHGGGKCDTTIKPQSSQELGLHNVGGVFLVLIGGCSIGLMIGILEFLWNVKDIAVAEKITPFEALKNEIKFALKVKVGTKPVRKQCSESPFSTQSYDSSIDRMTQ